MNNKGVLSYFGHCFKRVSEVAESQICAQVRDGTGFMALCLKQSPLWHMSHGQNSSYRGYVYIYRERERDYV